MLRISGVGQKGRVLDFKRQPLVALQESGRELLALVTPPGKPDTFWLSCETSQFLKANSDFFKKHKQTSLAVQCLGLCVSTTGSTGSIPAQGTKIP